MYQLINIQGSSCMTYLQMRLMWFFTCLPCVLSLRETILQFFFFVYSFPFWIVLILVSWYMGFRIIKWVRQMIFVYTLYTLTFSVKSMHMRWVSRAWISSICMGPTSNVNVCAKKCINNTLQWVLIRHAHSHFFFMVVSKWGSRSR